MTVTQVSVMTMGWETLARNDMLTTMHHLAYKVMLYIQVINIKCIYRDP